MPQKHGPGCNCCGESCAFFLQDDFTRSNSTSLGSDWNETVAGWEILSNAMRSATNGAIALTTITTIPAQFIATFTFTAGTSFGTSGTCEFNYRFGIVDSSNYWYVKFAVSRSAFVATVTVFTTMWRVSGGTATQFGASRVYSGDQTYDVHICASEDLLHWYVVGSLSTQKYSYPLPAALPATSAQGFELVSVTGSGSQLIIDNYSARTHISTTTNPTAPTTATGKCECPKYCRGCQDNLFPDNWQVTIAGLGVVGAFNYATCNGTYTIPGKVCGNFLFFTPCANGVDTITITFLDETSPFGLRVQFLKSSVPPPTNVIATWTKSITGPTDCLNFDETMTTTDLGGTGTARVENA